MTLAAGTQLGPYEILSPLGAGGMGEVYRARDTRLDRTVAVKALPSHTSASAETRQRFEREAKTISQLSHPHICALYDVGREGETECLVKIDAPSFEVGAIHPLFQSRRMGLNYRYEVAKDGKRFLVNSGLPQEPSPITLVTNWNAELEKKK